jgi:hypothetical protein
MKKKILCFLISIFYFFLITNAQELSQGTGYKYESYNYVPVFYSNSNFSSQNIYYNKYFVFSDVKGKDTLFIVDLTFNKNTKTIEVKQVDKQKNQSPQITVKFHTLSKLIDTSAAKPIYCIKNYRCNDTTISPADSTLDILFSVVDTAKGLIFLHQLNTFDETYHFNLIKFRNSYLKPHLEHAKAYWAWYIKDSIGRVNEQSEVTKEKIKIREEKDSLIRYLETRKKELQYKIIAADPIPQTLFVQRMDKILSDNLYETQPVNIQTKGEYKICKHLGGKQNEIIEEPTRKYTDPLFFAFFTPQTKKIDSTIVQLQLESKKVPFNVDSAYTILYSRHKARCERSGLSLNIFKPLIDSIYKAIADYRVEIEVPTIYYYKFDYNSTTTWQRWVKRGEKFKNLKNDSIIKDKKNINDFNIQIPQAKNGKYDVRLNRSKLNDSNFGPNVDTVYRKYKFITYVGFNIGSFITFKKFAPGDPTNDGKLLYWNLFIIYHHVGVFGGTSLQPFGSSKNLTNCSEVGVYIAPGNYFYFKAGLSLTNKDISGLVGASLIFPVFQFEAGYNFAVNYTYFMLGFNIPLNK